MIRARTLLKYAFAHGAVIFYLLFHFRTLLRCNNLGWVQDQEDWGTGFTGSITAYLSTCMDGRVMEREDYVGDFPLTLGWKRAGHWRVGHGYDIKGGWEMVASPGVNHFGGRVP